MLAFVFFLILDAKVAYREAHRVDRMLSFLPSRRNWDSPNPSPAGECAPPPLVPGGGAHLLAREGMGESQFRRGDIHFWYSICICTLWGRPVDWLMPGSVHLTSHWTIPLTLTFKRKMVMLNVLCVQECLTVVEPVKGKHCLALVLPDVEKILARYVVKGTLSRQF
jgi:hypothetical protein